MIKIKKLASNVKKGTERAITQGKIATANVITGKKAISGNESLLVDDLKEFAEIDTKDAVDLELNNSLTQETGGKKGLNTLTVFYDGIQKIEGIIGSIDTINDDILVLRDIIDNLYILAKNKDADNKKEILDLQIRAKRIMSKIAEKVNDVSNLAVEKSNKLVEKLTTTKSNTDIDAEIGKYNTYATDGVLPTNLSDKPKLLKKSNRETSSEGKFKTTNSIGDAETIEKYEENPMRKNNPTGSKGGNPYKTAKKQLSNIMSYIPGMSRKTQKKHRKNRKH
jgi:hypothetical protein